MKKYIRLLLFIPLISLAGGGCYQDPIVEVYYKAKITTAANLRDRPCMQGTNVIAVVAYGEEVTVIADNDGWIQIKRSDGTQGWIGTWLSQKIQDISPDIYKSGETYYKDETKGLDSNQKTKLESTIDIFWPKFLKKLNKYDKETLKSKLIKIDLKIDDIIQKKLSEKIEYALFYLQSLINNKLKEIDAEDSLEDIEKLLGL